MPTYEMPLLLRIMSRPETVVTLKRTAQAIFDKGGFIRKIENLGKSATPYKMVANNQAHKEAQYFVLHFDAPPASMHRLGEECQHDVDIVRVRIFNKVVPENVQCTLHEEMLPPAYRPEVQKMMEIGAIEKAAKEKRKKKFQFNTGLDYYPFQR